MSNNRIVVSLLFLAVLFLIACNQKQRQISDSPGIIDTSAILKRGDTISNLVQKILLSNVMQAMKSGGSGFAVSYCSENAITLTDSMAKAYNCQIRRVSDRFRNPANKPTDTDSDILAKMSKVPLVLLEKGNIVYYKPIKIAMPTCLKCHGSEEKDIDIKTLEIIKEKYPKDLATNYKEGDFRGLWKITFLDK